MLINNTKKDIMDYSFALIQYFNITTSETFNMGIVLKDSLGKTIYHIPHIESNIDNCINVEDKPALNYTLKEIKDKIDTFGTVKPFHVNDVLSVGRFRPLRSIDNPDITLNKLIEEYVSLKKLRITAKKTTTKKYDKRNVMSELNLYANKYNIKNFQSHKTYKIAIKPIDLALIDKDENPYSIATITSPHVENFQDGFITNLFTLQEAQRNGNIKHKFLHTPVYKDIEDKTTRKKLGWAIEQAKHYKLELLHDPREAAVFEMLQG